MNDWNPAFASQDGRRTKVEITETVWIKHFLPLCDDPQKRGVDGAIPRLYPQGLLAVFLREEGFSFREVACLINRDLAHTKRMDTSTRKVLRDSLQANLDHHVEDQQPDQGNRIFAIIAELRTLASQARYSTTAFTGGELPDLEDAIRDSVSSLQELAQLLSNHTPAEVSNDAA